MKNVMILVPNLQGGGQERVAALTSVILEEDCHVVFVMFNGKNPKYAVSDLADVIDLSIPDSANIFHKITNVFKRAWRVRGIRKSKKIDVVISFGRTANIVNCLSKGQGKTLCSIRNTSKLETGERNAINQLIYSMSDGVICVSEGQRKQILQFYPQIESKSCVIYNPCDVEAVVEKSMESPQQPLPSHTIVSCGRLEKVKCYANLFNAVKLVRDEIPDLHLIVLGEGTQRKVLEEQIKQLKLEDAVTLAGFSANPFQTVCRADMFVLSSSSEGFPNVVAEALACAVPVVSTDCKYGPREILSNNMEYGLTGQYCVEEFGVLVPAFEVDAVSQPEKEAILAEAIKRVLQDVELQKRLREIGPQRSREFSLAAYREKMLSVIDQ